MSATLLELSIALVAATILLVPQNVCSQESSAGSIEIAQLQPQTTINRPLVFIPGILGSKLCRNDGSDRIVWGALDSYTNVPRLALPMTVAAPTEYKSCGVIEHINVLGPFKIHQYDGLFDYLTTLGYVKGKTLFVFDYDWRQSNFTTADKLERFVEDKLGNQEFDILGHSMGGIIGRIYLQKLGGNKRVVRLITLGTPHRGSPKVFHMIDEGWGFWANLAAGGITKIRETLLTFPSVYELLPSYKNCCYIASDTQLQDALKEFDAFDADTWNRFRWIPEEFATPEGRLFISNNLRRARELHDLLNSDVPRPVEFIPIIAGLHNTKWKVTISPRDGAIVSWVSHFGDGTVTEWSAANGKMSLARPSQTEHQRIFIGDDAQSVIRWALVSDVEPKSGQFATTFRGVLAADEGKNVNLERLEIAITPDVIRAGQIGTVSIRLVGERALSAVSFRSTIDLQDGSVTRRLEPNTVRREFDDTSAEVVLTATFNAPHRVGPHNVVVKISGIEALEDQFLVIP